jgi:spore maturation protein A
MLNYIWGGLIIISLIFALVYDTRDLTRDTYRNGAEVTLDLDMDTRSDLRRQSVTVDLPDDRFRQLYGVEHGSGGPWGGTLVRTADGMQLRFAADTDVPEPLATIREMTSPRDNDLRGPVLSLNPTSDSTATATIRFEKVRFVKMQAIASAAFSMAETAVTLALGLIGVIALWMGLLKIAEASGMIHSVVRFTQPVFGPLFPEIPKGHPALGMIVLNLTANMLGLGNAATPLGIKAMEELQTLNPNPDTATNSMVMLLAMNTASVQLVPPVILVALMGLQINELIFAILIVTSISLAVAILSAKFLSGLKRYRITATEDV